MTCWWGSLCVVNYSMLLGRSVYDMLVAVLEARYKETHTTVAYNAFAQNFKYRTQHPQVLNVSTQ